MNPRWPDRKLPRPRADARGRSVGGLLLRVGALLVTAAALVFLAKPDGNGRHAPAVQIIGSEQSVFVWSRDACDQEDIPDAPARAFRDASGNVQLLATSSTNRRMIGRDLDQVRRSCEVVMPSGRDPEPAAFNDNEWIAAPYTPDGKTVYALVHNEYQGHQHPGRCNTTRYQPCWYNSITLAVSRDGGRTYQQPPAPTDLVASVPYRYEAGAGPFGLFQPSSIVRKPDDGYYYTLIRASAYREQKLGVCVLRTRDLSRADSWRAWDGDSFDVRFANPYAPVPPDLSTAGHLCEPVDPKRILGITQSLTYSTYLDKFVLVGGALNPGQPGRGGIFVSLSDDLIDWSPLRLLRTVELGYTWECGDEEPIGHPSLLDPDSKSQNFETIGREPYLYFTRVHYQGCRQTLNRDLLRVRVRFSK